MSSVSSHYEVIGVPKGRSCNGEVAVVFVWAVLLGPGCEVTAINVQVGVVVERCSIEVI